MRARTEYTLYFRALPLPSSRRSAKTSAVKRHSKSHVSEEEALNHGLGVDGLTGLIALVEFQATARLQEAGVLLTCQRRPACNSELLFIS
jgi:hypothetical protein